MSELDNWKLCCALTPVQAAALISGVSPIRISARGHIADVGTYRLESECDDAALAENFSAALHGLSAALRSEQLYGDLLPIGPGQFDLSGTLIDVDDICSWLTRHGIKSEFFANQQRSDCPNYLNHEHPQYAPKLAAAIRAWEAVTSQPQLIRGTTPKQALQNWLTENATEFGLQHADGSLNKLGVEEISKLANWKPEGGASKTPSN